MSRFLRTFFMVFVSVVFLFPAVAVAAVDTHYVTEDGAGLQDGTSSGNAFSADDFNTPGNWDTDVDDDNKIGPGDTVYFSGEINTPLVVQGSGTAGNYLTLDGYAAGDYDAIANSPADTVAKINTPGYKNNWIGILVSGKDYIKIQDFEIEGTPVGILINGPCDDRATYITVKDCYIHDSPNMSPSESELNYGDRGINLAATTGTLCRGNDHITIGGAAGDGNRVENIGGKHTGDYSIKLAFTEDVICSHNLVAGDGVTLGRTGISWEGEICAGYGPRHAKNVLIEYNVVKDIVHESAIGGKHGENIVFRFNKVYNNAPNDQEGGGIRGWGNYSNFYIYGNLLYNNTSGVDLSTGSGADEWCGGGQTRPTCFYKGPCCDTLDASNIHVWANIIYENPYYSGINVGGWCGNDFVNTVRVYNNTIVGNGETYLIPATDQHGGIIIRTYVSDVVVKNNLFVDNIDNDNESIRVVDASASSPTIDYNRYYVTGESTDPGDIVYWYSALKTVGHDDYAGTPNNEEYGIPGFIDQENNDYRLDETTAIGGSIDGGEDLSALVVELDIYGDSTSKTTIKAYYDDCLSPDVANMWTDANVLAGLPTTVKQDTFGTGWEIGAYVYTGELGFPQPVLTMDSPSGGRTIEVDESVTFETTLTTETVESYTYAWTFDSAFSAYAAGTTYNTGNVVTFDSKTWKSLQDSHSGNQPEEGAFWTRIDDEADPGTLIFDAASDADGYHITCTVTDGNSQTDTAETDIIVNYPDIGGSKITVSLQWYGSEETGKEAANLIDGDTATRWHTQYTPTTDDIETQGTYGPVGDTWANSYPGSFVLDCEGDETVVKYVYTPRNDGNTNGNWASMTVYYMTEANGPPTAWPGETGGEDWVEAETHTFSELGDEKTRVLNSGSGYSARYWLFYISSSYGSTTDEWASAEEIALYNATASSSIVFWANADSGSGTAPYTLDADEEESAGDDTADPNPGHAATVTTDSTLVGTKLFDFPTGLDFYQVSVTGRDLWDDTTQMLVSFWFYGNTLANSTEIFTAYGNASEDYIKAIWVTGGNILMWWESNNNLTVLGTTASASIDTGEAHFIQIGNDQANEVTKVWVDNVLVLNSSVSHPAWTNNPLGIRWGISNNVVSDLYEDQIMISKGSSALADQSVHWGYRNNLVYPGAPTTPTIVAIKFLDDNYVPISDDPVYLGDGDSTHYVGVYWSEPVSCDTADDALVLDADDGGANDITVELITQPPGFGNGTQQFVYDKGTITTDHNASDLAVLSIAGTITATDDDTAADTTLPTGANTSDFANVIVDTTSDTFAWAKSTDDASPLTTTSAITIIAALSSTNYVVNAAPTWPRALLDNLSWPTTDEYTFYYSQKDADEHYFRIYPEAGWRTTAGQNLDTTGDLIVSGGTFEDSAGNPITATPTAQLVAGGAAYVLSIPKTDWSFGSLSTDHFTKFSAFDTATRSVPGDIFTFSEDATDTVNSDVSGTAGNLITLSGGGHTITGNYTIDEDYWKVTRTKHASTVLLSGDNLIHSFSIIPSGSTLQVTGASNTIIGDTIKGTLDIDASVALKNVAVPGAVDLAAGQTLTGTNCAFEQSEAEIEVGGGTVTCTDCQFEVSDMGFIDEAGGNFKLGLTSVLLNTGVEPFSDGDGDQYDLGGRLVWSDTTNAAVGRASDGWEIGAYAQDPRSALRYFF